MLKKSLSRKTVDNQLRERREERGEERYIYQCEDLFYGSMELFPFSSQAG
jgi:hypothetical protein